MTKSKFQEIELNSHLNWNLQMLEIVLRELDVLYIKRFNVE